MITTAFEPAESPMSAPRAFATATRMKLATLCLAIGATLTASCVPEPGDQEPQESAKPVFERWQKSLATITSDRLRQRSELRYAVAKERYDAIAAVAVPAQEQFDGYVKALRDHAAFLANDLNAGAIDDIQDEVKVVARTARDLDHSMESCLAAARAYVEQSALPSAAPAPSR